MRLTRLLRTKTNRFDEIIRSAKLTLNEAPQILKQIREEKQKTLYEKIVSVNKWYMQMIGIDKVKTLQDKVMALQDDLVQVQEKRREIDAKLNDARVSRSDIHDEMTKIDKDVDFHKYIELRNQETEILKVIQMLTKTYNQYDGTEKELFTSLTSAIRDSNEQQRLQMEHSKYIGLILSIASSFLTFFFATLRKEDLKRYMDKTLNSGQINVSELNNTIQLNSNKLENVLKDLKSNDENLADALNSNNKVLKEVLQILSSLKEQPEVYQYQKGINQPQSNLIKLVKRVPSNKLPEKEITDPAFEDKEDPEQVLQVRPGPSVQEYILLGLCSLAVILYFKSV
ncbi:keratin, type II cytoskeletal 1 isoform X2 [Aethina tumida]|uniref:keratin, type II cytoskeletal 1 isoform X2 n=1 Tax=Aethina tumida TaxID=116153 RepID=UPI00096B47F5|nr:keratin, type II cytoskeletal 1 isoform X2 [Aethina tumida]